MSTRLYSMGCVYSDTQKYSDTTVWLYDISVVYKAVVPIILLIISRIDINKNYQKK